LGQAYAQSPEAFKYQAVIRDANNAPLAWQSVRIRISILESSATGSVVYQEFHAPTTSAIGLVSLNIGEGTVLSGSFDAINFELYEHFLQVEVDETGGTNYYALGTSKLLSVPYALVADVAATALDVDDADADPANEIQDISLSGKDLSISQGSTVTLDVDDADADPNNEIQDITLNGNALSISQGSTVNLPTFTAGDGISIVNGEITNLKPSLWEQNNEIVFVDSSNLVGIGISSNDTIPDGAQLFVNGNLHLAPDSNIVGVDEIIGFNDLRFAANPTRSEDMVIANTGRVTFEEEVGINQTFSFIDLNVRNQPGNSTVFQVEDTTGSDLFEV
ncbi:MAG: hypothetical protein AAFO91_20385, partial [Bacteroidota bacterium]